MKAVLLAGGFGTRLLPLTLNTPKPIVPIFDRPFLFHQIDVLKRLPDIDEVILSLNYQPERIRELLGAGVDPGVPLKYVVEPSPLGTGGAVKYAEPHLDGTTIVFNGDVLTAIDLPAVLRLHRERRAAATIVLTPVDNPSAYGLVETDADSNVTRFLEKPAADEITCNTINAGIYVLEPDTFDRIPSGTKYSIERAYFPSLIDRGETFVAYIDQDYWLDIGTPAAYLRAHRDIMGGRCAAAPFADCPAGESVVATDAKIDPTAIIDDPCFVGSNARIERGAHLAPHSVVGRSCVVGPDAVIDGAILWPETVIGDGAVVRDAIIGHRGQVGSQARLGTGVVLGDDSTIAPHSKVIES